MVPFMMLLTLSVLAFFLVFLWIIRKRESNNKEAEKLNSIRELTQSYKIVDEDSLLAESILRILER